MVEINFKAIGDSIREEYGTIKDVTPCSVSVMLHCFAQKCPYKREPGYCMAPTEWQKHFVGSQDVDFVHETHFTDCPLIQGMRRGDKLPSLDPSQGIDKNPLTNGATPNPCQNCCGKSTEDSKMVLHDPRGPAWFCSYICLTKWARDRSRGE